MSVSNRPDRAARTAAFGSGGSPPPGDLRARLQQLSVRQQRFQKYLAESLHVDQPGLEAMGHLISTGPSTPSELARRGGLSTAAMSLVLNRLEAAGHVSRQRHPLDGRKLVVTASPESADEAQDRLIPMIEGVEELVESLNERDRATIGEFLDRLIAIYDASSTPELEKWV
jgi:DNA-binding MarR family transcriptional regulator